MLVAMFKRSKKQRYPLPLLAIILAAIPGFFGILGIGHFYLSKKMRGGCFLLFGILIMAVIIFVSPTALPPFIIPLEYVLLRAILAGAWVWQVIDAYRLAKKALYSF